MYGSVDLRLKFLLVVFGAALLLMLPPLGDAAVNSGAQAQEISGKVLKAQQPDVQLKEVTLAISGMV